ncbi:hypothetical protein B0I35DRAFT_352999 [Stachybotrys elegans]|uniref:Uncharacterized protein n=1 Tax=Stachybotrys elegans TaxID=80388 RepID=A0A8K0WR79_9HYPO|nr:hypothetical protein B0I35DRAFT_352999 [Stachybotrys elegans]
MKTAAASLLALATLVAAEVPQEHSHERFLTAVDGLLALDNPLGIQAAVFGLLGNAAASEGAGQVTNFDCLQQITADQAFTNAKAAGDVDGMANALIFRAIERNTGSVGLKSVICNETATNPEIAAISQHQDPASEGAAAENKAITLALAQQLAIVGADPQLALLSGTFEPGQIGDPTGAGNTCDDLDDPEGCIFTKNLLVEDATADEIDAAVAEVMEGGAADGAAGDAGDAADECVDAPAEEEEACVVDEEPAADDEAATPTSGNLQTFTGTLGGAAPPVVSQAGQDRPFVVNGATFNDAATANVRSCDIQNNQCFNAINSGQIDNETSECLEQQNQCIATARGGAARVRRHARGALRARQDTSLDLGSCTDPTVIFAAGLDNRQEESFGPASSSEFDHGSALNIGIITSFICGRLSDACKAPAETVQACQAGASAAAALQGQAAADAFNTALGF